MPGLKTSTAVAFAAALMVGPLSASAEGPTVRTDSQTQQVAAAEDGKVIVIDAPDLRRVRSDLLGPRFTSLIGEEIYSNSGKKIGEIEDFVMARGGNMYAVIDTSKGPIQSLFNMGDDEMVILPLREVRRAVKPTAK